MSPPQKDPAKKKSPLREFFQWMFDLSLVGLIVWYFSNPQNTTRFWATISQWWSTGVSQVGQLLTPGQSTGTALSHVQPTSQKTGAGEQSKAPSPDHEKAAPPPFFVPPPLPTAEELN